MLTARTLTTPTHSTPPPQHLPIPLLPVLVVSRLCCISKAYRPIFSMTLIHRPKSTLYLAMLPLILTSVSVGNIALVVPCAELELDLYAFSICVFIEVCLNLKNLSFGVLVFWYHVRALSSTQKFSIDKSMFCIPGHLYFFTNVVEPFLWSVKFLSHLIKKHKRTKTKKNQTIQESMRCCHISQNHQTLQQHVNQQRQQGFSNPRPAPRHNKQDNTFKDVESNSKVSPEDRLNLAKVKSFLQENSVQ